MCIIEIIYSKLKHYTSVKTVYCGKGYRGEKNGLIMGYINLLGYTGPVFMQMRWMLTAKNT